MALRRQFDHALFALAVHAALLAGLAATALAHVALGQPAPTEMSGAHQWTSAYSVNNAAPVVAAATGFAVGHRDGARAAGGAFVGTAVGYLLLLVGTHALNVTVLDVAQRGVPAVEHLGNAAGVGATAALFAVVAAYWA
jgi:hypothetical protein